ncbi:MAG: hypothetical protein AAF363_10015 [Bacteroidota bacterium]
MRKFITIFSITLILSAFSFQDVMAQCNAQSYSEECIGKLPSGFTFLKSFQVDGQGGAKSKVEYSYVFSKDTQYSINICADGESTDGIVVSMYDSNRRRVMTNYIDGNFYDGVQYPCKATGIYYITFTFEGSSKFCGGSVLGFKR